jgi:hypothetical protein
MTTIFDQWREGEMSDEQAARALALELGEVESELAPLTKQREELRNDLSHIVGKLGDKHTIPGFGELVNTAPSVTTSYDAKKIEAIIIELVETGLGEWAQRLTRCKKQSSRAGSLRITREK